MMSRDRTKRFDRGRLMRGLAVALVLATLPCLAAAQQGNPEAANRLNEAIRLLGGDNPDPDKALEELDKAIEADPTSAQAFYYRGMAFGQVQQLDRALEAFLRAAELSPGYTEAHVYACRLAWQFQDWDMAWEQAILAAQAGFDMSQAFAELRQVSDEPDDLAEQLRAPRVLLGGIDVESVVGQDSFLNEPVSIGNAADASSRGSATAPSVISPAFGDGPGGETRFAEAQADIANVRRTFGVLLQDSRKFAVVQSAELANYVLTLKVNDVGAGRPREMEGIVKLMRGEDEVYSRPLRLSDIASTADLRTEIFRQVVFMEEWFEKQQ